MKVTFRPVARVLAVAVLSLCGTVAVLSRPAAPAQTAPAAQGRPAPKRLLAWGDVRSGYQHDSISHAFAVIERLGRESGLDNTWIPHRPKTITKGPIHFANSTGIATGEQFLALGT